VKPEDKDNIQWKARIYKDKTLIPQIEEDLKVLVQVILGDKRTLKIQNYKDITYADGKVKKFDMYPSCKNWEKKFCHCKEKEYEGRIPELGYVFFGDNKIEIYCQVISAFAGRRTIVPFSY
jgi:hypothetical protein